MTRAHLATDAYDYIFSSTKYLCENISKYYNILFDHYTSIVAYIYSSWIKTTNVRFLYLKIQDKVFDYAM